MSEARKEAERRWPNWICDREAFVAGVEWARTRPVSSNGLDAAQEIERLSANWMEFVQIADELHDRVCRIRAAFAGQNVSLASKIADEDMPYEREPETRAARPEAPITDAQVEAAAKALRADRANRVDHFHVPDWENTSHGDKLVFLGQARAALEAAREVQA